MTSQNRRSCRRTGVGFGGLLLGAAASVATVAGAAPADPQAAHRHRLQAPHVLRSTDEYIAPNITLLRADGARVNFARELNDGRPVLLDFIYTTCTTICPVMSQTFADVQKHLGVSAAKVKMMSISIDPEGDTPSQLREYAKRYHAGGQWSFYTGPIEASIAVQRAFNVYRGDKMNHAPVTLYRGAPGQPWVRLDGFATPEAVLGELPARLARN